jgi:hypothetical protein
VLYNLPVPAGALARCTTRLDGRKLNGTYDPEGKPYVYNCSDSNKDGSIPFAVLELPQYIEVAPAGTIAAAEMNLEALPAQAPYSIYDLRSYDRNVGAAREPPLPLSKP